MAVRAVIGFLVFGMLLTGCCNTLLTKYQDMQCVENCDDPTKKPRGFEQPVIQTVQMFIGESGCWLVIFGFYLKRMLQSRSSTSPVLYQPIRTEDDDDESTIRPETTQEAAHPAMKPLVPNADDRRQLQGWKIFLLALPSSCDIAGTTLMNVGLLFVAASIYQMIRGALILFVGVFSVIFLKRKLYLFHWLSMLVVVLGVALVGLSGAIYSGDKNPAAPEDESKELVRAIMLVGREVAMQAADPAVLHTLLGIFLIAAAQIFTATQFCLEEWILENYALEPIKVVGWEGLFGLLITIILQIILHFTVGITDKGRHGYFDAENGYSQVIHNRVIAVTSVLIMFSIGSFNFFGLSVTRSISATARSIIDTCRTLFIWLVSLGLHWESFKWLQVVGFALLVYGTVVFNGVVHPPIKALMPPRLEREERGGLLQEEPIEHM